MSTLMIGGLIALGILGALLLAAGGVAWFVRDLMAEVDARFGEEPWYHI